jgi:tRNA 2-thiouridine synthesizing protein E
MRDQAGMRRVSIGHREYALDGEGFLLCPDEWSEEFADALAPELGIEGGLTERHWKTIYFIRDRTEERMVCPLVYETCREVDLEIRDLEDLFPTGYLRGACKLAGCTYRESFMRRSGRGYVPAEDMFCEDKLYRLDVRGFLADSSEWDEKFATHKAFEMKMPGLSEEHWRVLRFLRERFGKDGRVPTIHRTCEAMGLQIGDLELLFPDGYHRGAVKIAGLRTR